MQIRVLFLIVCIGLSSCQTSGQENGDGSSQPARKMPAYVMEELPSTAVNALQSTHFQFFRYGKIDEDKIKGIAAANEATVSKIQGFTKIFLPAAKYSWYLYPSVEVKGLMLKNSSPCQVDFEKKEIHAVVNDIFLDYYLGKANELLLDELLGTPQKRVLKSGLAVYFTDRWQKMGYRYWAGKLAAADQLPTLADLLNNGNWEHSSDLIFGAAAAAFCDFAVKRFGKKVFLEKYKSWESSPGEINSLEPAWQAFCKQLGVPGQTSPPPPLPYLKGFNFAHEGYRIYNGYGSRKADLTLGYLKQMNVNSVAIVPYTFMKSPNVPSPIPVAKWTGAENDESVIHTSESAQALGMKVVLKPQVWMGRGFWTGDIDMQTEEDWQAFFKHYGHWIAHYAMLCEIYGWEMLCTGNEMVKTTLKRGQDWRKLIRSIRKIYSGNLTYAANWGEEFENIKIWDELDYIGLNSYYPLSKKDDPSNEELDSGFEQVVQKIETVHAKYQKQVIFTEIGFPCAKAPWKEPHQDWGDLTPDPEQQKRCYVTVFKNIQKKPWCSGILWWKYPSDMEHRQRQDTGFSPHGKAAEDVVAKWFAEME
ncbi:MAG TPA: hypothetical protein ENJ95_14195 [Bacteroidetes bacterium]|nr:hypothetical protein [Bacteroidota bacterium]